MPKGTDTYARAYEACAAVFTELARFPTIDLIRDRIGVNSPVVIKRAITDWTLAFADRHREKMTRPDLPGALLDAADNLWKLALLEADTRFKQERQQWTEQQQQLEQALAEARQTADTLTQDLNTVRQDLETEQASHTAHREELQSQWDAERAARTQAETTLAEVESKWAITNATLTAERTQFAERHVEWERRLDAQHIWHLNRIEEEKKILRDEQQLALMRRDSEIERLTLDVRQLEAGLRAAQNQAAEWRGRAAAIEENLNATRALNVKSKKGNRLRG